MCDVIQAIEKELPKKLSINSHPLLGTATINVGVINGGTQSNIVPDTCKIKIDRRILPGENFEDVQTEIENILKKLRRKDPELNASVKITKGTIDRCSQPMEISSDEKIVKAAISAVEHIIGTPAIIWGSPGYTDASPLVNKAKIPTIVLGPGRVGHTQDEHVHIYEVVNCAKVYALIMKSICK
jgi:acetylornithine deacetylase/succinyl-diaminopimelate desuccinylase-like protein